MKIGELAKLSGLSASRIRFYEASGLIHAVDRKANGYRDYPPEAAAMLDIIASAQSAGFTLDEIRHLLPIASKGHWQHEELLEAIQRKVVEIEAMQKRLEATKAQLLTAYESIKNRPEDLSCIDRAKWVMERLHGDGIAPSPSATHKPPKPRRSSGG
ncbi:MerR family transcriptional regulator [Dyella japonica]|uniref:MerR family transcriptional regulator n=1 Tax=Dyella japonica A8 TaxID=1217721 RepID=A0A075K1A6_9GAMM|nr:MerR family transcriptional regulator [Dyella japonica]AIF48116.1 MerR family transcriptional regulator [Dyella japonica A8]